MSTTPTTVEEAFQQGAIARRVEGADSQLVYNPYDDERDAPLYEAWDGGFNSSNN